MHINFKTACGFGIERLNITALVKSGVQSLKQLLFRTIVEHTAAELFNAATQDRSTIDTTMRVGVDRRAQQSQR